MREIDKSVFLAEGSRVIGDVVLKEGSAVWYNAVIRADTEQVIIGKRSNIQDCCVVHVDPGNPVHVGDDCTVGHGAILHGCTIGDNSLIGMGSIIMNGAVIGKNSVVGAGALVTQNKVFPEGSLILGSPAKAVRKVTQEEIEGNRQSALEYAQEAAEYLAKVRAQ